MDDKGTDPAQTALVEQRVAAIEAVFEARGMEPKPFIEAMAHTPRRSGSRAMAHGWSPRRGRTRNSGSA
jgi:hypothetical protein